jgi:hypothetical protein
MKDSAREQQHQHQIECIAQKALDLGENSQTLEELSKSIEVAKTSAEASRAYSRANAVQFWAGIIAPLATVLVAAGTICYQAYQTHQTLRIQTDQLKAQAEQFVKSSDLQRAASEDAQWRDTVKSISFDDPSHAVAGALAMTGFFAMSRHAKDARMFAASLAPMMDNVEAFDDVLTALDDYTTNDNQKDIIGVAQKVRGIEWSLFERSSYVHQQPPINPFFTFAGGVLAINFIESRAKRTQEENLRIGAYEADTVSHALWAIWKRNWPNPKASPEGQDIRNVVLENYDFSDARFHNAKFGASLIANAGFKRSSFRGASFDNTQLVTSERGKPIEEVGVLLDEADLCEVTQFDGSDWSGANWWDAKCISPELHSYLLKKFPPSSKADLDKALHSARK